MDASSLALWLGTATVILYLLYRYTTSTFTYFSDQGIPGPKPLPIIGNMWGIWKMNMIKHDQDWVKKYGKVFGAFDGSQPILWTTDPELIRSIFVKDFDHFVNRRGFNTKRKVTRKMMTLVRGQEWKDIRSSVTPAFTTGKIKRMSVLIEECAKNLAAKFESIAKNEGKMNAKNEFSAFTMDVIARCAFGMKIDNLGSEDDPFMKNAKNVFNIPIVRSPLILLPFILPSKLLAVLSDKILRNEPFEFFIKILENLIEDRHQSKEKYNDFVEIATETISEFKKDVDGIEEPLWNQEEVDEIVIAQSALFLVAGFDTTGTTLTATIFNLAKNPEIQDRLYNEIQEKLEQHEKINHDMILDFPFLDNVINETLRMTPPGPRLERECNEDVICNGIKIKKGMIVTVPVSALHYDPEHYPEPETFNPDRWNNDNKDKINPYVFMPFGMGPRNCVGMRFALEEMKIVLCTIINQFRFFPVPETPEAMQMENGFIGVLQPIDFAVGIELRN